MIDLFLLDRLILWSPYESCFSFYVVLFALWYTHRSAYLHVRSDKILLSFSIC